MKENVDVFQRQYELNYNINQHTFDKVGCQSTKLSGKKLFFPLFGFAKNF